MKKPYLSVVVGVYNEAGNIAPLIGQLSAALEPVDYELIYVNDGSTDATLAELKATTHGRLTVLDLQKNYGQSLALAAGIDAATGTFIVTMDGDGQNDPTDILRMLETAERQDVDLVMGIRQARQDGFWLRKLPSQLANALVRWVLKAPVQDNGCGIKLFRAELAKSIGLYGEMHRFVGILAYLEGARIVQVPVRHHARTIGQSKYGLSRTFRVLSDLIYLYFLKRYRHKPMHLFGGLSLLLAAVGVLLWVGQGLGFRPESFSPVTLGAVAILGSLQLAGMGVLAEMQLRTYHESQGKKPYRVRRVFRASAGSGRSVAAPVAGPIATVWPAQ